MTKILNSAEILTFDTIRYEINANHKISALSEIKLYVGDRPVTIKGCSTLNVETNEGIIELVDKIDLTKKYTLELVGVGTKDVIPTAIFDSEEFINNYVDYDANLGAVINGNNVIFNVWAPTASNVELRLYKNGHSEEAFFTAPMTNGNKGTWTYEVVDCPINAYYTYLVTTMNGTQEAVDPYARAVGVNGKRGMVVDLSSTNPSAWNNEEYIKLEKYTDAIIWEVHVRDFSNKIKSSQYKGKYLALTERGLTNSYGESVGIDYLVNLGITHVHLLPIHDYATVDETKPDEQFNWGYDPANYNALEGSYSLDPYNGEVRIKEFKMAVQALHNANLGVIMDVVYNHTYHANSSFNKIVPYYYYRFNADGTNISYSGCGNDTASEHLMFRKFMVESTAYWVKEYKLDGLRFDLMGLHDLETIREIEKRVHEINPNAIIYGEGWNMGKTLGGQLQANQNNVINIEPQQESAGSVSVFSDVIRDGLKGSTFCNTAQGYVSGNSANLRENVKFGISGGEYGNWSWCAKNGGVINYISAHDNHTLWDKLAISNGDNSVEERIPMNKLGAAIVMISKGTPFMQAGEEMLRTKHGDENSYNSSDEINNIDWESLTPNSDQLKVMNYYKGLIELRKASPILRAQNGVEIKFFDIGESALSVLYEDLKTNNKTLVIINPTDREITYYLDEEWKLFVDANNAGNKVLRLDNGDVTVNKRSIMIYKK